MHREFQAYLVFTVFITSGISFLPGKLPRTLVRITVAAVGIIAFLLLTGVILFAISFSVGFGARSFGGDGLRMLGTFLLAIYFAVCSLTCLPVIPDLYLRRFGLGLHFVYLPLAVGLVAFGNWDIYAPLSLNLSVFSIQLSQGLVYAMLWFRMIESAKSSEPA